MATKIITQQLIVHDANGLPKGMLVEQSTFEGTVFVETVRHELTCLPASSIAAYEAAVTEAQEDLATATNQLETVSLQKASLVVQVTSLQSQLVGLPDLQAQLADLQARLAEFYDPNVIKSESLYNRITKDELFALAVLASSDANAKGILELLSAYKANAWKVLLNDPQVVGAMQYLTGKILASGRAEQITTPASRDEAWTE